MIFTTLIWIILPFAVIISTFIPMFNATFNPGENERILKKIEMCKESNSGDRVLIEGKEYEC